MKQLLLSLSLLAILAIGCGEPTAGTTEKDSGSDTSTAANDDHADLLPEVNQASLVKTIAENPVTIIEFTSDT